MSYYEYVVVPVPKAAPRAKGVKRTDDRFAHGLSETLNRYGAEGWEYQRNETLNVEARAGFFSRPAPEQITVMIFRRWVEAAASSEAHLPHVAAERYEAWRETAPAPNIPAGAQEASGVRAMQPLTASRRPAGDLHPLPRPDRP